MNDNETENTLQRLPLWRGVVEQMLADGVAYGMEYDIDWFAEKLRHNVGDMKLSLEITEIRRALMKHGFYLCGRVAKGKLVLREPLGMHKRTEEFNRECSRSLKWGLILGTKVPLDALPPDARKKHESLLQKMATRAVLFNRTAAIRKVMETPKLLKAKAA